MVNYLELLGWLGVFLFTVSCIPQVLKCHKDGHAEGLSWSFLVIWLLGEIVTLIYVIIGDYQTGYWHWPLVVNYVLTGLLVTVMIRYKIFPTGGD